MITKPVAPVGQVHLARCVHNLHDNHEEVSVHFPDDVLALFLGIAITECVLEVFERDAAVALVEAVGKPAQGASQSVSLFDRHCLGTGDDEANGQIDQIIQPEGAAFVARHRGHSVDSEPKICFSPAKASSSKGSVTTEPVRTD